MSAKKDNTGLWLGLGVAAALGLGGAAWWYRSQRGAVRVREYSDNLWWKSGVLLTGQAGLLLEVEPEQVKAGDKVALPGGQVRTVLRVQGSNQPGATEVYLSGSPLNPATYGAPVKVHLEKTK